MDLQVFASFEGWGEKFLLAILGAGSDGAPLRWSYTDAARARGLELSPYLHPLAPREGKVATPPAHQFGLPGPVYDALPDGWGLLLMDGLMESRGLDIRTMSPLRRLLHLASNTMGAITFEAGPQGSISPSSPATDLAETGLLAIARSVQKVQEGAGQEVLGALSRIGGAPHGARPKALVDVHPVTGAMSTEELQGGEPWLFKFPLAHEHPEVSFIEDLYARAARACGLDMPNTLAVELGSELSAFGVRRFDRVEGMRVPMHTLAGLTGANYRIPGVLTYSSWLQATKLFTKDVGEVRKAFERAVFNVVFNNRDDHGKNFSYCMDQQGQWRLSPVYDVTFNEGPGGYHHMSVSGEARSIGRMHLLNLAAEAQLPEREAREGIDRICSVAATSFSDDSPHSGLIRKKTLQSIRRAIANNVRNLKV